MTIENQMVGQYRELRVLLVEKSKFSHWVGSENWRYFPEKSTNIENFSPGDCLIMVLIAAAV
jgi:hypothetical protein